MAASLPSTGYATHPFKLISTPIYTQKATKPYDPFVECASIMAVSHNVFIRGLNSIYLQAPHIPASQNLAFINYCLCFVELLNSHHRMEEEKVFPVIEEITGEKGIMDQNIEQHHAFTTPLNIFHTYLTTSLGSPSSFSGTHLNTLIDAFAPPLIQHLTEEIPTLLDLARFRDRLDLLGLFNKEGGAAGRSVSKTGATAFMVRNLDLGYEEGLWSNWPAIPPPVWWIIQRTFVRWNASWWQFASSDARGHLRELPFLEEEEGAAKL